MDWPRVEVGWNKTEYMAYTELPLRVKLWGSLAIQAQTCSFLEDAKVLTCRRRRQYQLGRALTEDEISPT